jgi:hypothetical protein
MAGKNITEKQAAETLAQCKASPADILFVDERPAKLQAAVAQGAGGKEIAKAVGVPENVGKCAAVAYGLEEPSAIDKAKGWLTGVLNRAAEVQDAASKAVSDLAIKPGQGPTSVTIHNNLVKAPEQKL